MKTYIEFKKKRELGDIFSDTFTFIRNEYKPFFKTVFSIAGPYMLLLLFSLVFYMYVIGDQFSFDFTNPQANAELFSGADAIIMLSAYLAYFVSAVLAYTFMASAGLHYMKSYEKNQGAVNFQEIKDNVHSTFWGFLGLSFLKGLTLLVAMFLCCLPVLYFIIPMTVVLPLYVFANRSATDSYSESYSLVRDELLATFGTIFLFWILVMVINSTFALPTTMYTYLKMGIFSGEIDPANLETLVDPVYIALNVISSLVQFITNLIITIASVFIYFNLNERKHFTGTFERIESLGKTE